MHFLPKLTRRTAYQGEVGHSGYRKYKKEISEDCKHRCVYCDLHANYLGGYDVMELDHLRPKAKKLFPQLKNDPLNLLFSCRSCNGKKRDDWPAGISAEFHISGIGYIDPFDNRWEYFEVDRSGCLVARKPPSQYVINQLALNRPLAVAIRHRIIVVAELMLAVQQLKDAHDMHLSTASNLDRDKLKELTSLIVKIAQSIANHIIPSGPSL